MSRCVKVLSSLSHMSVLNKCMQHHLLCAASFLQDGIALIATGGLEGKLLLQRSCDMCHSVMHHNNCWCRVLTLSKTADVAVHFCGIGVEPLAFYSSSCLHRVTASTETAIVNSLSRNIVVKGYAGVCLAALRADDTC